MNFVIKQEKIREILEATNQSECTKMIKNITNREKVEDKKMQVERGRQEKMQKNKGGITYITNPK